MHTQSPRSYTREAEFAAMVRDHQAALWRYLRYLGCEPSAAEDLVQESFLAVWRKPFEDRGARATSAYLRTVARNQFLMAVRKKRVRPAFRQLDDADQLWAESMGEDEGDAYRSALKACLATLKERPRRALDLFYGKRSSREDVGRQLSMTAAGVKTLLRRARDSLRACVERRLGA
ncbi:MAG: RNA polymerase sigma factor [Planctomycetota bacterium]|jgi:RNA polymerase sigma-70 factor (ECF subfamily)